MFRLQPPLSVCQLWPPGHVAGMYRCDRHAHHATSVGKISSHDRGSRNPFVPCAKGKELGDCRSREKGGQASRTNHRLVGNNARSIV